MDDNDFQLAYDSLNIENLTEITLSTPKIDFPQICKNDITLNQMINELRISETCSLLEKQILYNESLKKISSNLNIPLKIEYDLDLGKPIMYNIIYYYYGTPKLCINLGYFENENDATKLQTSFQILNYHKNIVIEISNFIIGDEIICDKLKYPKHYGRKNKIYEKNELFDRIRNKNKVIILKNEI